MIQKKKFDFKNLANSILLENETKNRNATENTEIIHYQKELYDKCFQNAFFNHFYHQYHYNHHFYKPHNYMKLSHYHHLHYWDLNHTLKQKFSLQNHHQDSFQRFKNTKEDPSKFCYQSSFINRRKTNNLSINLDEQTRKNASFNDLITQSNRVKIINEFNFYDKSQNKSYDTFKSQCSKSAILKNSFNNYTRKSRNVYSSNINLTRSKSNVYLKENIVSYNESLKDYSKSSPIHFKKFNESSDKKKENNQTKPPKKFFSNLFKTETSQNFLNNLSIKYKNVSFYNTTPNFPLLNKQSSDKALVKKNTKKNGYL